VTSRAQLHPDWLDALAIVRAALDTHDIRGIFAHYEPVVMDTRETKLVLVAAGEPLKLRISHPQFPSLPKIERVEIMTYAALGAWWDENYGQDMFLAPREAFRNLCFRAGCWHTNTPDVRERWRLIDWTGNPNARANTHFESRPVCGICSGRVATGAGAYVKSRIVTSDKREEELTYRPDLHEECVRYAHRVLSGGGS